MRCPLDGTEIRVSQRFVLESTGGPMEHIQGMCERAHPYCGPVFYAAEWHDEWNEQWSDD